jgi:hypothetical protein
VHGKPWTYGITRLFGQVGENVKDRLFYRISETIFKSNPNIGKGKKKDSELKKMMRRDYQYQKRTSALDGLSLGAARWRSHWCPWCEISPSSFFLS